jgi:hypothetical protein
VRKNHQSQKVDREVKGSPRLGMHPWPQALKPLNWLGAKGTLPFRFDCDEKTLTAYQRFYSYAGLWKRLKPQEFFYQHVTHYKQHEFLATLKLWRYAPVAPVWMQSARMGKEHRMTIRKRGDVYHYQVQIKKATYCGTLPTAKTMPKRSSKKPMKRQRCV